MDMRIDEWTNTAEFPSQYRIRSSSEIREGLRMLNVPECMHTDAVNFVVAGTGTTLWATPSEAHSRGIEYSPVFPITFNRNGVDRVDTVRLKEGYAFGKRIVLTCETGEELHLALWDKCSNLSVLTPWGPPTLPPRPPETPEYPFTPVPAPGALPLVLLGILIIKYLS